MNRNTLKHKTYLEMAETISKLSRDESTKVGCILVDLFGKIISTGYNGTVAGIDDSQIDFSGKEFETTFLDINGVLRDMNYKFVNSIKTTKNKYMIHAELNAILSSDDRDRLKGSTAYITHYPCNNCSLALAQSGIKHIFVLDNKTKSFDEYIKETLHILSLSGISLTIHKIS